MAARNADNGFETDLPMKKLAPNTDKAIDRIAISICHWTFSRTIVEARSADDLASSIALETVSITGSTAENASDVALSSSLSVRALSIQAKKSR